jgi:hypothetical protein
MNLLVVARGALSVRRHSPQRVEHFLVVMIVTVTNMGAWLATVEASSVWVAVKDFVLPVLGIGASTAVAVAAWRTSQRAAEVAAASREDARARELSASRARLRDMLLAWANGYSANRLTAMGAGSISISPVPHEKTEWEKLDAILRAELAALGETGMIARVARMRGTLLEAIEGSVHSRAVARSTFEEELPGFRDVVAYWALDPAGSKDFGVGDDGLTFEQRVSRDTDIPPSVP